MTEPSVLHDVLSGRFLASILPTGDNGIMRSAKEIAKSLCSAPAKPVEGVSGKQKLPRLR